VVGVRGGVFFIVGRTAEDDAKTTNVKEFNFLRKRI
jgi:hypothetical protein